jgi:hypothetical protein
MPPTLGLSQKKFKVGQTHTFKVFGDGLGSARAAVSTAVQHLAWRNVQTAGNAQNHINIKADLVSTTADRHPRDTAGDLTVTVTDSTGSDTTEYKVTYTP